MKSTTASEVAKYFIASFQKKKKEISNLKLQKLLYYAQAWHLALYDLPLFDDKIEAWVHGPVVPSVFREYKPFGWRPIHIASGTHPRGLKAYLYHLNEVVRVYGKFDPLKLERLTHCESPWRDARGTLAPDAPSHKVISHDAMKKYYGARLVG